VRFTLLVPNDYSLLEEQTGVSQGDSVFQHVVKDRPDQLDDLIDPDEPGADSAFGTDDDFYVPDGADGNDGSDGNDVDVNHKPDHESEEMIVGRPENGNGGLVALPPGAGGLKDYPSVWTPGTGTVWNRYPPGGSASGDATDWQPAEGERQLLKQKLEAVTRDPADPTAVGTADRPFGPNGLNELAQYIDPRTVNRVVSIQLTHPPNSGGTDPRYPPLPALPAEQVYSPPTVHPFGHKIQDDTTEYNDLVDELVVCTTVGAYLLRSKTDANGVTTYDPPVLISDASAPGDVDVRDVTTADFNQDGVRDLVVVTGPGSPDSVYLADPTDPLMKKVGENSDVAGWTPPDPNSNGATRGGLRKEDFGRTLANGGGDGVQGTPDDVYTTALLRDSTSVVALDPDGDSLPDLIIVGTRSALDYMICCGDASAAGVHDVLMPSGGAAADTESVAAAMLHPPLNADGTRKDTADLSDAALKDSTKITVVFGTGTAPAENRGSVDYYLQIRAYTADGTAKRARITDFAADVNVNEKTLAQLPGSVSGDEARVTHTVTFVEMKRSVAKGTSTGVTGPDRLENHLYLGYQHQDMEDVVDSSVFGHYYDPADADPDDLTAADRGAIGKDTTMVDFMRDGMRGLDVLLVDDTAVVYLSSNGGSVYEIIPTYSSNRLEYDHNADANVKLGVMRADGTTLDLTTAPATDETRDAEYSAGLVVVANFDGDDYPDVLSGRHISYNGAAAGTRKHDHDGQRGIYDASPVEWWTFGPTPSAVEALDADADGDLDLVVIGRGLVDAATLLPADGAGTRQTRLQLLLNDGSGNFERAERRAALDTGASDAAVEFDDKTTDGVVRAAKIATGQLNAGTDARDDVVVLWPNGAVSILLSNSGSDSDADAAHKYTLLDDVYSAADGVVDVLVASLTGVAAADATKRPQEDVLLLLSTGAVALLPGTALAAGGATASTVKSAAVDIAAPTGMATGETVTKIELGHVLRSGPGGSASGFMRKDAADGDSGLPLRESGGDANANPTDTSVGGDTLAPAIIGQTDNAGNIRDELEPELRVPDIVLAGSHAVYLIAPSADTAKKLVRTVTSRYGTSTAEKLFSYPSSPRPLTGLQVHDSVRGRPIPIAGARRRALTPRLFVRAGPQRPRRRPPQLPQGRRQHHLPLHLLRPQRIRRQGRRRRPQPRRGPPPRLRRRPARRRLRQLPRPRRSRRPPGPHRDDPLAGQQLPRRQRRGHDSAARRGRRPRRLLRHHLCIRVFRRRARRARAQEARRRRAHGHYDRHRAAAGRDLHAAQRGARESRRRDRGRAREHGQLDGRLARQLRHDAHGHRRRRGHLGRGRAVHGRGSLRRRQPGVQQLQEPRHDTPVQARGRQRRRDAGVCQGAHDPHYGRLHAAQPGQPGHEADLPGAEGEGRAAGIGISSGLRAQHSTLTHDLFSAPILLTCSTLVRCTAYGAVYAPGLSRLRAALPAPNVRWHRTHRGRQHPPNLRLKRGTRLPLSPSARPLAAAIAAAAEPAAA
jgi:hypothetical protein